MIPKVAIHGAKYSFPLIILSNSHLILAISEIQLDKLLNATKPVQRLANEGQGVLIFDVKIIENSIIDTQGKAIITLFIEKDDCTCKDFQYSNKLGL